MTADSDIRLDELASMEAGWLDGAGERIQRRAIDQAHRLFRARPSLVAASNVVPTPTGGVMLEFEAGGWDLSVECLPGGGLEFFGVEIQGVKEVEPRRFSSITSELLNAIDEHAGW